MTGVRRIALLALLYLAMSPLAYANVITPTNVYQHAQQLSKQLEEIRVAMGKPKRQGQPVIINGASPREVYFIAQSLYEKTNRLAQEITGSYKDIPSTGSEKLTPSHVLQMLQAAEDRIAVINKRLNINNTIQLDKSLVNKTPTDVINMLLSINGQLNQLLYQRFSPSNVYEQVTLAVNYTAHLLAYVNSPTRIPKSPAFIANATPKTVYKRLIECSKILNKIANNSKLKMLTLKLQDDKMKHVIPGDVYQLSKVIVSEVRYLNTLTVKPVEMRIYYPGYKTPSEVLQRVNLLYAQLVLLDEAVAKNNSVFDRDVKK